MGIPHANSDQCRFTVVVSVLISTMHASFPQHLCMQGREWMRPLKNACGPKLMALKFHRKKKHANLEGVWFALVYGVLCLAGLIFCDFKEESKPSNQACWKFS